MKRVVRVVGYCLSFVIWLSAPAFARDENGDKLRELIQQNTFQLSLEDGELAGDGAEWLVRSAESAQFFMVGEQHATADIAQFSAALYRRLQPRGYNTVALEIGRFTTEWFEALIRREGEAGYRKFAATGDNGFTVPFLFFDEELPLAMEAIAARPEGHALWGVDQEFIASGRVLLDELDRRAATDAQRAAVAAARERAAANIMWLGMSPTDEFTDLQAAFVDAEDSRAKAIVDEIVISNRIYSPFTGRGGSGYLANLEREQFMKTNFKRHLEAAAEGPGNWPKVFMKFGANHVAWGHSPTHVLSLGTFVRDIAWAHGFRSFNLHVDCQGGEARNPQNGEAVPCDSYFLTEESAIRDYLPDDKLVLVDLAALRPQRRLWRDWDERSQNLVWAFDALLVVRDPRPATFIGAGD